MDILVLSPCSSDKYYDNTVLDCEVVDGSPREKLVREHSEFVKPAGEMYTGDEHQHIRTAVSDLREISNVDWNIISAGFGLLQENTEIPMYDCGFSKQNIESVRARAKQEGHDVDNLTNDETIQAVGRDKRIPQEFERVLNREYDLLFVVLSEPYLLSVADALIEVPEQTTGFAFAAKGSKDHIGDCHWVPATETERKELATTWMRLRGKMLSTFATNVDERQLNEIPSNKGLVETLSSPE